MTQDTEGRMTAKPMSDTPKMDSVFTTPVFDRQKLSHRERILYLKGCELERELALREGYKLVPVEPTQKMLCAGLNVRFTGWVSPEYADKLWRAMIAASDSHTSAGGKER